MFEKVNSLVPAEGRAFGDAAQRVRTDRFARPAHARGESRSAPGMGGNALRAIEWSELNARLDAARDLRVLLRRDAKHNIEANAASFGDAAARYFAALEHGERRVNPDDLEARKASGSILRSQDEDAARGDARDD